MNLSLTLFFLLLLLLLLLVFTAVEFISQLDNIAFELATTGYVGTRIKKDTEELREVQFPISRPHLIWIERLIFNFLILALFAGWGVILYWQQDGTLLERTSCETFSVAFGDEVLPFGPMDALDLDGVQRPLRQGFNATSPPDVLYSFFSGTYLSKIERGDDRPTYF